MTDDVRADILIGNLLTVSIRVIASGNFFGDWVDAERN
jgi:hypothetical protein